MGANAVLNLFTTEPLDPSTVGRLYLGTESALDSAKPTATYILDLVEQQLTGAHGANCLRNVDAVDMTFACIGAVDALENACLFVRQNPEKKAIIVRLRLSKGQRQQRLRPTPADCGCHAVARIWPRRQLVRILFPVALQEIAPFE